MTLVVVSTAEHQSLSFADAGGLVESVPATWRVGTLGGFARALTLLLAHQSISVDRLVRIVVCLTVPSFTTQRTTASFVNASAWSRSLPIAVVDDPDPVLIAGRLATGEPRETTTTLFPSYPPGGSDSRYTTPNGHAES
jgi:hypothetical protein